MEQCTKTSPTYFCGLGRKTNQHGFLSVKEKHVRNAQETAVSAELETTVTKREVKAEAYVLYFQL